MASTIDVTKPVSGNPTTASVRDNFTAAKSEIETLQTAVTAAEGDITTLEAADTILADAIALKAPISSPTFTGTATIPTAVITNLTFNGVVITATGADLNATTGLTAALAAKAPLASPTFTGTTTIPTADINGGTIDGANIGESSAARGTFTVLTANNSTTFAGPVEYQTNPVKSYTNASASTSYTVDASVTSVLRLAVSDDCSISFSNMVDGHEVVMFIRPTTATSHTISFGLAKTGSVAGVPFSGSLVANSGDFVEFRAIRVGGNIYVTSPSKYL